MQQRSSITITPAEPIEEPASTSEVKSIFVSIVVGGEHRGRRSARDDRLQLAPVRHAAADVVDELAHRDPVRQLVVAGIHDVTGEREHARAGRVLHAELRVLRAAHLEHRRHGRDRLDVVHRGRRRVEAGDCRERRLRPRLAALPLERLEERRLLTADVCTRAAMDHDGDVSEEIALAHRLERVAEDLELALVLAADVDEDVLGLDPVRRDEAALEEAERDAQHDLAVLERPRLGLVGVDDEVVRLLELLGLRDERPLAPGREERRPRGRAGRRRRARR